MLPPSPHRSLPRPPLPLLLPPPPPPYLTLTLIAHLPRPPPRSSPGPKDLPANPHRAPKHRAPAPKAASAPASARKGRGGASDAGPHGVDVGLLTSLLGQLKGALETQQRGESRYVGAWVVMFGGVGWLGQSDAFAVLLNVANCKMMRLIMISKTWYV